jgi:hypothetical protein
LIALLPSSALGKNQTAAVQSVKVVPQDGGAVVEILASHPLTPEIQTVESPLRLVIDLPGSAIAKSQRRIHFRDPQIKGIRIDQYKSNPATARIVLDLAAPVRFTWNAIGNRLNIRIRPDQAATAKPLTVPAATPGTQPIAVPYGASSTGTLVEAGSRVGSGSSISAKDETAVLRLTRGGEVRVCPGTTLSVATSSTGQDLMLGMNTGAIETHYHLNETSDSILTPDFRIVLPGPGEFNLAVKSDPSGNTCVGSLPGSNSSVVVAEILGTGTYEVKPDQQVLFRQGRMQSVETPVTACGCPPPQEPVMRAAADPASVVPENKTPENLALANSNEHPIPPTENAGIGNSPVQPPIASSSATTQRSPESQAQISTPLVFDAKEFARMRAGTPPQMTAQVAELPITAKPADPLPPMVVLPPPAKPEHKGFFGKIGGFFRAIF